MFATHLAASLKLLPFVVAIGLLLLVPRVERFFLPVLEDFIITSIQKDEKVMVVHGYVRKVRDCEYVGTQAWVKHGQVRYEVPLVFPTTPSTRVSDPSGPLMWGPITAYLPLVSAEEIRVVMTHKCHPLWVHETQLLRMPVLEKY